MAKKDKKEKKGGLLGRLFGGGKGEDAGEATPPAAGGGDERTIAPGYVPEGEAGDLTMAPGYVHASPEKSGEIGHVSFGTGRFQRPEGVGAPAPAADPFGGLDDGAAGRTIAPGYAADDDDMAAGELTMAPGYAGPELSAPKKPADPFADPFADLGPGPGEMTMAPGYAGAPGGKAPGGKAPGGKAPPADPFADLGAGELTMAPGYAGAPVGKAPGGKAPTADPFADFGADGGAGELTMAPGYAGAELTAPKKPADPFADPFADLAPGAGAGELTMAPGYAGAAGAGGKAPPADPFADAFDVGGDAPDLTMAPGYASGGAKPARGGPRPGEPFVELDAGDLTMAPAYAPPGGGPAKPPRALDPFADLEVEPAGDPGNRTMAPEYAQPAVKGPAVDAFDIDLGGPPIGGAAGAPVIPEDAFSFEPAVVGAPPPRPTGPVGGEPFDPFGPALLDDPFAQAPAGAPPVAATPPATPVSPLASVEDDDFRGERTMVDLTTDVDMLATLEATDELPTPDTPPPVELEGVLEVGAALPPPVAATTPPPLATAPPPVASAPARPAPRARPMFQGSRPDAGGTRHVGAAAEVVVDAARGLVFAPAVEGGWTGVPAGFRRLSDGAVVGRGRVDGRDVVVAAAAAPPPGGDELRLEPFPAEVKVDRATRTVLWPTALEDRLTWRPPHLVRVDAGLLFVLPEGARFEDDGAVVVPASAAAAPGREVAAPDPTHGRVTSRSTYLGLVEEVHEDGWARLTLPAGAAVEPGRLVLPAVDGAGTPPLLRPERLPDGRLAVTLPAAARAAGDVVWVPPTAAAPADEGEPWSDRDAGVVETRHYAGVREELLDDGWLRLELPVGARVEQTGAAARVVVPPEYSRLGDPAALLELDRLPCGSVTFELPGGAECLGWRVLVPPASDTPTEPPRRVREVVVSDDELGPQGARRTAPDPAPPAEAAAAEVKPEKDPDPPSRKMKALELFRKDKKKPQNDTITFDGVLRSESAATGGAVSPDVPAPPAEPPRPEVVAAVEEPVAAAVEAAPAAAEAGEGDLAAAVTGAFSLDDAATPSTSESADGLEPTLEPAMPEPAPLEPQLDAPASEPEDAASPDAEADAASADESSAGDGDEGGPRKTGRRKRKKGK